MSILARTHAIEKFIGPHATTQDYEFQEHIRKLDLAIEQLARHSLGEKEGENFSILGWGKVIGAAYLLEKNPAQLKISDTFKAVLQNEIQKVISKASNAENPLQTNVASNSKVMITHRQGKMLGHQPVDLVQTIQVLNQLVKKFEPTFTLNKNSRIYLELASDFFTDLWKSDFASQLESKGFVGLERSKECPHVTLINSPSISKIKEQCDKKSPQEFHSFISRLLDGANKELREQENPIVFTKLNSKYCEDYSPFEEIVVAKLDSPFLEKALEKMIIEVAKELNVAIDVTKKEFFHITIAVKHRQAEHLADGSTIESLIDETGPYSKDLNHFWTILKKKANS